MVAAVAACWAWVAFAVHVSCWHKLRASTAQFSGTWGWMSLGTASITVTYAVAYTWLVFGDPDRAAWSELLGYVALVGWPVVWILPGIVTLQAIKVQRGQRVK